MVKYKTRVNYFNGKFKECLLIEINLYKRG